MLTHHRCTGQLWYRCMHHRGQEHLITVSAIGVWTLHMFIQQLRYMTLALYNTWDCCLVFVRRKNPSYYSHFHGAVAEQLLLLLTQVFSFVWYCGFQKHLTCQLHWRCVGIVVLTLCWCCLGKDAAWQSLWFDWQHVIPLLLWLWPGSRLHHHNGDSGYLMTLILSLYVCPSDVTALPPLSFISLQHPQPEDLNTPLELRESQ